MTTSLSRLVAHPILAPAASPDGNLISTITSGLLDVLVFAFLLLAAVAFLSYRRSRPGAQARGNVSGGSGRSLGTIASVMLAVPVVWLLVAGGTSLVLSYVPPNFGKITPSPTPTIPKPKPSSLASDLIMPGKLIVGSVTNNPPQEYFDAKSHTIGFDIDLIRDVAQRMKLQMQIVPVQNFQALFGGLKGRQFDVAISAVSMTSDLTAQFDFVPYLKTSKSLLVPKGNPKGITGLADLCGLSVGVQDGSTELIDLQQTQATCPTGAMITNMTGTTEKDVVQLLLGEKVAATYLDTPAANYYKGQNPGKFDIVATPSNAPDEGIMIRKGDTVMFNAVQTAFASLKQDGTYGKLITNWSLTQEAIAAVDRRSGAV